MTASSVHEGVSTAARISPTPTTRKPIFWLRVNTTCAEAPALVRARCHFAADSSSSAKYSRTAQSRSHSVVATSRTATSSPTPVISLARSSVSCAGGSTIATVTTPSDTDMGIIPAVTNRAGSM